MWNKIEKQVKDMLLKDLSPIKLKQLSLIFALNPMNNSLIMQNLFMTLLVDYDFIKQ